MCADEQRNAGVASKKVGTGKCPEFSLTIFRFRCVLNFYLYRLDSCQSRRYVINAKKPYSLRNLDDSTCVNIFILKWALINIWQTVFFQLNQLNVAGLFMRVLRTVSVKK